MKSDKNQKRAADKITEVLNRGFILTPLELHFIESSYSVSSADDLKQLILVEDSELDVICELVVSPDDRIREDLELFLYDAGFSEKDEEKIVSVLCKNNLESKIIFPATGNTVLVTLNDYLTKRFITKLRITSNPDMLLHKATETLSKRLRLKTLVRIRHSCVTDEKSTIEFLIELVSQKAIKEEDFFDLFGFAVSSIEEVSQPTGIMEMFINKKRFYEKTLSTIKEVRKQLETSAVETLMMQGTRIPPYAEGDVESKIEMAATILAVIFGYTDIPDAKPSEINLGNIPGKKDIKKVFRILS